MRQMFDALNPLNIPLALDPTDVAAYVGARKARSYDVAVSRFPRSRVWGITIEPLVPADIIDCEPSTNIHPLQCPAWVMLSRAAGYDPTVYCNQHDPSWGWSACVEAFTTAGVAQPHWWVADANGNSAIPAGTSGVQYTFNMGIGNPYDTSNMLDDWPAKHAPTTEDVFMFELLVTTDGVTGKYYWDGINAPVNLTTDEYGAQLATSPLCANGGRFRPITQGQLGIYTALASNIKVL